MAVAQSTSQYEYNLAPRDSYNYSKVRVYEELLKDPDEPVKGHDSLDDTSKTLNKRLKGMTSSKDTNSANQNMN